MTRTGEPHAPGRHRRHADPRGRRARPLHAVQRGHRPGRGQRRRAVAFRSRHRPRAGPREPVRLPRRYPLARCRRDGAVRGPDLHGHERRPADRSRRNDRQPLPRFRNRRRGAHRSRYAAPVARRVPDHVAARDGRRHRRRRFRDRRQRPRRGARGFGACLRRQDRRAALGVGPDPARRERSRGVDLAGRATADRRPRQRLGADGGGRGARPRVRADQQPQPGLLRRPAPRRQPARQLRRRPRGRDGPGAVELPDRASRHLGLRRAGAAGPVFRLARRRAARRGGPGDEDRLRLRPGPRHGRAVPARRGTAGSADGRSGRAALADAAVPSRAPADRAEPPVSR